MRYTGVLRKLVAEVSTRGTDRLERKVSIDVRYFGPAVTSMPSKISLPL